MVLQPDQPILSRKMSACPIAATNSVVIKTRQKDAMVLRGQSDRRERTVESTPKQIRDVRALRMLDEGELAIGRGKRDAREHIVILR